MFISKRNFASALLAATIFLPMASMAQQRPQQVGSSISVPPGVPDGSTLLLFGDRHWGMTATVINGRVPSPPSGSFGNFRFPDGKTWYSVGVTPPPGWVGTIMAGKCQQSTCPSVPIKSDTYAIIAP
jgi:hypothetical protein